MGLLDDYFDPEQFQASGGLLGRLLSLPQMQGLYQPSMDFDPLVSADNGQAAGAQMSVGMPRSILQANGPAVNPQTPVHRPTQDIPIGVYRMPQFGRVDVSQAVHQPSDPGDHLSAGFQSWAHARAGNPVAGLANGITGLSSGLRIDAPDPPLQIAQALAGQTKSGNTDEADPFSGGQAGPGNEAGSITGGQPPVSKAAYKEIPTNANQAFGELSDIRQRNPRSTVSGEDHLSGVREGNVRRNDDDGSLEVTNGAVVTFSLKNGRAKVIIVTNEDIARIDGTTGEVVIQKSPLGDGI